MPQPTKGSVHVDRPLTNISVAYANNGPFIADRVFPNVPVSKQSDVYFKYTKADWLRSIAQKRAPGTPSAGGGWTVGTDSYRAEVTAIHKDIDEQTRANADVPLSLDREATMWVTRQILLAREIEWASTYMAASTWGTDVTGVTSSPSSSQFIQWDQGAATPVEDVTGAQLTVQSTTGVEPNVFVVEPFVAHALRNNSDVIERIKYTQRGVATNDLLAAMFGVDDFFVVSGIQDTSNEGATESPGFIQTDKDALLVYRASTPSLMEPSGGYTFVWTGLIGSVQGWQIKRFYLDEIESDRVEGQSAYDQKLVAADVGYYFDGAIA